MPFQLRSHPQDPEAFAELFEQTKNLVYKTAYLMLGNVEEAEEALQEVFVLVYKSIVDFNPLRGAITTWLHRITVNYCLGVRRKRRVDCQPLDDDDLQWVGELAEPGQAPFAETEAMAQAIQSLSEKQRAVVILRYYWDLPYAEIAQILDIPLGTVKSRIDRSLRNLRQILVSQEEEMNWDSASEEEINP